MRFEGPATTSIHELVNDLDMNLSSNDEESSIKFQLFITGLLR